MAFYIYKNEQQLGPFDESELGVGLADGTFIASDLAWNEQIEKWVELGTIIAPNRDLSAASEVQVETPDGQPVLANKRLYKGMLLGIIVILITVSIATYVWKVKRDTPEGVSTATYVWPVKRDTPEKVVAKYLEARVWEERLQYVRSPEIVKPLMADRYRGQEKTFRLSIWKSVTFRPKIYRLEDGFPSPLSSPGARMLLAHKLRTPKTTRFKRPTMDTKLTGKARPSITR